MSIGKDKKHMENIYDKLIDNISGALAQTKNIKLVLEDENAKKIVVDFLKSYLELHAFKTLYQVHFLPATELEFNKSLENIKTSKYKDAINKLNLDFEEDLYETIRFGYVGLFHKYEAFINRIKKGVKMLDSEDTLNDVFKEIKKKIGFDLLSPLESKFLYKVNWICNCVKHCDGYPIRENPPNCLIKLDKSKRIIIGNSEFLIDIDKMIGLYVIINTLIQMSRVYLMMEEEIFEETNNKIKVIYFELIDSYKNYI